MNAVKGWLLFTTILLGVGCDRTSAPSHANPKPILVPSPDSEVAKLPVEMAGVLLYKSSDTGREERTFISIAREPVVREGSSINFECIVNIFIMEMRVSRPFGGTGELDLETRRLVIRDDDREFEMKGSMAPDLRSASVWLEFRDGFAVNGLGGDLHSQEIHLVTPLSSESEAVEPKAETTLPSDLVAFLRDLGVVEQENESGLPTEVDLPREHSRSSVVKVVANCPTVTKLRLACDTLTFEAWDALRRLESLEDLDVGVEELTSTQTRVFAAFTMLEGLTLRSAIIDRNALAPLTSLRNLKSLYIDGCQLDDGDLLELAKVLPGLRFLAIHNADISDAGYAALSQFKQLESLNIAYADFGVEGLAAIAGLSKLRSLDLQFCETYDESFAPPIRLPQLQQLTLGSCEFYGSGLQFFAGHQLAEFNSYRTAFDAEGLRELVKLKTLKRVVLEDVLFDDQDLQMLSECPQLESIFVSGGDISPAGRSRLQESLPNVKISP